MTSDNKTSKLNAHHQTEKTLIDAFLLNSLNTQLEYTFIECYETELGRSWNERFVFGYFENGKIGK